MNYRTYPGSNKRYPTKRTGPMMPKASEVKITKPDGTIEIQPAYRTAKEMKARTKKR